LTDLQQAIDTFGFAGPLQQTCSKLSEPMLGQTDVYTSHIKNPIIDYTTVVTKEKNVAAKCPACSAVGQSLMASVCQ